MPKLPALPTLPTPAMPLLPAVSPVTRSIARRLVAPVNPLDVNNALSTGDDEHDTALDMAVMADELSHIRAAREQQRQAVELANDYSGNDHAPGVRGGNSQTFGAILSDEIR